MNGELSVKDLSYNVLDNVSFTLKKNTLNALIGKSGSGKSTLLNCIAHSYDFQGNITIDSNVITKSPMYIQYVSCFTYPFIEVKGTVFENIVEPLNILGFEFNKAKKKVFDISKKLGIENIINDDIETLSYSQRKMVFISKTLIASSDIILLDNVFDSLDSYYKNMLISYLKSIKNSIIIFTTNNPEDLMIADNIIIMDQGKIIACDKRNNIFLNESLLTKNNLKLPFIIDLSYKLKSYDLINNLKYNCEDVVDELWK